MLIIRQLVESSAVNAVCVLRLVDGTAVVLASLSECIHVYDLRPADTTSTITTPSRSSSSSSPTSKDATVPGLATSAAPSPSAPYTLQPRGHVFNVGCGIVGLLALAHQCFLIWTRDQECIVVRYQANLAPIVVDPRVATDGQHVYRGDGEPTPVHYKEHHWFVVHRVRLWCSDRCASLHPPEMGVNDSMEMVHLRFCTGHVFLLSLKWHLGCVPVSPQNGKESRGAKQASPASASTPALPYYLTPFSTPLPSSLLRTTQWQSGNYMNVYAGTGFHYPTQSCSVATRRPGEPAAAHQRRIEQLWQSGSKFANVPDEDLIATHAVGELSQRKNAESQPAAASSSAATKEEEEAALRTDWCGLQSVSVRRETYSSTSPIMPSPAFYCNSANGGFTNVRNTSGQLAVHHAPLDFFVSKSTPLKDDFAGERCAALAVVSPRRTDRRSLEWTLLAFVTSASHTAVYHLQRPRTMIGAPHYVLDGLFAGPLQVRQVLFCVHNGDASNDVWVALSSGAVTRFAVAELRARGAAALNVQHVSRYPWPATAITGLPPAFFCRQMLPADDLVTPGAGIESWAQAAGRSGISAVSPSEASHSSTKGGLLNVYPCARRYALLSDCVQDVFLVDLVARRVVASLAGDGPMTDVCEAPHGYVAAYARGMLQLYQPGVQLHVRGTARVPPYGSFISKIHATRVDGGSSRSSSSAAMASVPRGSVPPGVYVIVSTHHTSQLYRVEEANMIADAAPSWPYARNETTLVLEAFNACHNGNAGDGGREGLEAPMLVQCTPTRCFFGACVQHFPFPLVRACVAAIANVGPVCVGCFDARELAGTYLPIATMGGVCQVDVATTTGVSLGFPACLAVHGLNESGLMEVLVGRWDGAITVLEIQLENFPLSSTSSVPPQWRCLSSQTIQVTFGTASPVQRFHPLPRAGAMARWMTVHSSGEVSILALGRRPAPAHASPSSSAPGSRPARSSEIFYFWAPTSPPYRRAQQKLTCAVAPIVRASSRGQDEVYNGFDGALLQPRDGALLFFSVPLEEGDTQAPPHMQRLRESDEEDKEWMTRLETTVRAIVPPDATGQIRAAPWRCAVLLENFNRDGTLRYDTIVVQHDKVTLCTLDSHLFTPSYPRQRPASRTATPALTASPTSSSSSTAAVASLPLPTRAFMLAHTAPSRYVCTNRLQLPQLNSHETLVSIAREPDDEGEGVLLCVTVCEQTSLTRLTTLQSGTLALLESLVLPNSIAHWMSAVPPSTPYIARATPLFLLCSEDTTTGTVHLQVVAAHPLRIASSEVLEEMAGWMDVTSQRVKVDGAVQVVPTRINSDGDTYGGEVLVTVAVDHAIHLFVLRSYTLLFQHCVLAPACTTSLTLCYPIVSVCTEGDSSVYLQVYPVNDDTEVLAPAYSTETTKPLKTYGKVSWKMRVSMREPTFGACVLAQAPLYDRCVRADVEGDVTVSFINLSSAQSRTRSAAHVKGDDAYVGSAEGPQTFLTHSVRLPTVPVKLRLLRHVSAIQRRYARQLQCCGHNYHLQSSSVRMDRSSRMLLMPCHDGSLYGAFEVPYGFAHPLLRIEQVITDAYALDLSLHVNPSVPRVLQHTFHLQPFHVARALQPLIGTRQAEKQACVMADAVFEYFMLRDMMRNGCATANGDDAAVVRRKFTALDDLVQTLLTEEYEDDFIVDTCAEMLSIL